MGFSKSVAERVLVDTGRCCSICHKFCGFKIELHHIKQKADGGEDSYENCIPLCLDCHAEVKAYDPHHPKGRKYTENELVMHRDSWYCKVKGTSVIHIDEKYLKLDQQIYNDIKVRLFESGCITFLRNHHFGTPFKLKKLEPISKIVYEVEVNPEFELIDADLEHCFANLVDSMRKFSTFTAFNTFSHEVMDGYQYVPSDWLEKGEKTAKHYREVVDELNRLSTQVTIDYDIFSKMARRKFC